MLKTATETPSLASSQEGDVASIFQTCEREKAREQNLSSKATQCWEVRKNCPPLPQRQAVTSLAASAKANTLAQPRENWLSTIPQWGKGSLKKF